MIEASATPDSRLVLLVGGVTLLAIILKHLCERLRIPALVGYILIGLGLRLLHDVVPLLNATTRGAFDLLAALGLVALLFRVGLGSNPRRLIDKLPGASLIWLVSVVISAAAGYYAARWVGFETVPALVAAVALTATSIGVALPPWQAAGALRSEPGARVLDVAELDDISGVVLMSLLLAVIPTLTRGNGVDWTAVTTTGAGLLASLAAFTAGCYAFAHWLEPPLTRALIRRERSPTRMLIVVAVGSLIAALAGMLGFSLAVGALFAGLVFSKAPRRIRSDRGYRVLYDFLAPFFFIGIGLKLEPEALTGALGAGAVLLVAAVLGKWVGTALPARLMGPRDSALVIATSMVPRAEIAMVIVQRQLTRHPVTPPNLTGPDQAPPSR